LQNVFFSLVLAKMTKKSKNVNEFEYNSLNGDSYMQCGFTSKNKETIAQQTNREK